VALALLGIFALFAAGCGKDSKPESKEAGQETKGKPKEEATKHEGWWCEEHGIPEAECSMCSKKVAAEFQAQGDWCAKHKRAKSQCFKCDPKLKEVYAAKYRAHFNGKEPPPITDDD